MRSCKTLKISRKLGCRALFLVLVIVLLGNFNAVFPEEKTTDVEKPLKDENAFIAFIESNEKEAQRLKPTIEAGFSGDKSGEEGLYKLNLGINIDYDAYPSKLSFKSETSIQLKNSNLQENVNALELYYNYLRFTWLGIHGFAKRSSDSYLSIQQRYEIGAGFSFQFNLLSRKRKKNLKWESAKGLEKKLKDTEDEKVAEKIKEAIRIKQALRDGQSWLSMGLGVSLLSEFEKAEITTQNSETNGSSQEAINTQKFDLDGEHRFRIALEPSIVLRTPSTLTLEGKIQVKLPIGSPIRLNGKYDYRQSSLLRAILKLPKIPSVINNVSVVLEYQREYDNSPPEIAYDISDKNKSEGESPSKIIARNSHDKFVFKLKISF